MKSLSVSSDIGMTYFKQRIFEDWIKNEEIQNENQLSTAGVINYLI